MLKRQDIKHSGSRHFRQFTAFWGDLRWSVNVLLSGKRRQIEFRAKTSAENSFHSVCKKLSWTKYVWCLIYFVIFCKGRSSDRELHQQRHRHHHLTWWGPGVSSGHVSFLTSTWPRVTWWPHVWQWTMTRGHVSSPRSMTRVAQWTKTRAKKVILLTVMTSVWETLHMITMRTDAMKWASLENHVSTRII